MEQRVWNMIKKSREIKFRVWHTKRQCWVAFDVGDITEGNIADDENCTVQQYTGLKDKNGKEIYEGDVLSIIAEDGNVNIFTVKYGIARRDMKSGWTVDIPCFYFDLVGKKFKAFPIVKNYKGVHDLTMLEVIGTIYDKISTKAL